MELEDHVQAQKIIQAVFLKCGKRPASKQLTSTLSLVIITAISGSRPGDLHS